MAADSEVRDTLSRSPGFTGLGRVAFADNAAATRAFEQINQILSTRFGKRAPFAERAVTWADLQQYGFAKLKTPSGSLIDLGGGQVKFPDPIPVPADPTLDPSIPPAPSGLSVTGAVVTNILDWTEPAFSYFGFTEVWRSSANNLSTAVKIGQTNASLYADAIGQESVTYYYWIRHVSKAGNAGPYNASGGASATTSSGSAAAVADGSITTAKLASLAVATAKIADGAIVNAKIGDLSVTNAKIANATITDAKISSLSVGKLTAGALAVDQYIQSFSYNPGVFGWKIHSDGSAEFNQVQVRGTVYAPVSGHPTVQFGNNVGPGTGHFGLSLSHSDFNNIFLRRSDGVVFFRLNDGGANSVTYDSASGVLTIKGTLDSSVVRSSVFYDPTQTRWLDLRASPSGGLLLNTPGAKIFSDGSTKFSNVMAEGVTTINLILANGETREAMFNTGVTYTHSLGANFGAWAASVEVICDAVLAATQPPNAVIAYFDCEPVLVYRSIVLSNGSGTSSVPSSGTEVWVKVRITGVANVPGLLLLSANTARWRVFRVT